MGFLLHVFFCRFFSRRFFAQVTFYFPFPLFPFPAFSLGTGANTENDFSGTQRFSSIVPLEKNRACKHFFAGSEPEGTRQSNKCNQKS